MWLLNLLSCLYVNELTAYTTYLGLCVNCLLIPENPTYSEKFWWQISFCRFEKCSVAQHVLLWWRHHVHEAEEPWEEEGLVSAGVHICVCMRCCCTSAWMASLWESLYYQETSVNVFVDPALSIVCAAATNRCSVWSVRDKTEQNPKERISEVQLLHSPLLSMNSGAEISVNKDWSWRTLQSFKCRDSCSSG